jgi:penicillin amidase
MNWLVSITILCMCSAAAAQVGTPIREGESIIPTLRDAVIELRFDDRDAVWIVADTEAGAAQAQGYLHGQDRFFQMDISRRYAAGELAAFIGPPGLPMDLFQRGFLLRDAAGRILEELDPLERDLLDAYVEGVNLGLASIDPIPLEYVVSKTQPDAWTAEDSILVLLAMGEQLNGSGQQELSRQMIRTLAGEVVEDYLFHDVSPDDCPLHPDPAGANVLPAFPVSSAPESTTGWLRTSPRMLPGSNAWVVAGSRTADGRAILANDPHLGITAPSTWYRMGLMFPVGSTLAENEMLWEYGLTLPGVPGVIIGTNGHVAWGFTNVTMDVADLIVIETNPDDQMQYRTPQGWEYFTWQQEQVAVRGEDDPVFKDIPITRWGPVYTDSSSEPSLVRKWTLTEPGGVNLGINSMLHARNVDDAVEVMRAFNVSPQNVMIADADGRIAWIIAGRLPRRVGHDGTVPISWADEGIGWDGWLDESHRPVIIDPESGVLFSANNRMADLETARVLGREWAEPDRARRISELLAGEELFDESALSAMQLDTALPGLQPLRERLLKVIPADHASALARRARQQVELWNGTADADQRGLPILLKVDRILQSDVLSTLLQDSYPNLSVPEGPLRRIVAAEPPEFLSSQFQSWDEAYTSAFERAVMDMQSQGSLDRDWGELNSSSFNHFAAEAFPWAGANLNLPVHPQAGHPSAIRVAHPRFGASARLVVSPSHDASGILQTPGGQSGNYLSTHYTDYHDEWAQGRPTPLLPGEIVRTKTLVRE